MPAAVEWLAAGWSGAGPLDLSRLAVIVPTRQAGRRLRAGLAALAEKHRQAVFAPRVMLPESLMAAEDPVEPATSLQATLAWAQVVREIALEDFRAVFPVDPPERDFAWALHLAGQLTTLQAALGEAGLVLEDVAERMPGEFAERSRWQQVGALGRLHAAVLRRWGWREPHAARIAAANRAVAPRGVERIVLLATPDPLPLALRALAKIAGTVPVDVAVAAPESEQDAFDGWGRPRDEAWARREPPWENFGAQVHLLADAAAQAEALARLAAGYGRPDGWLGVAVADAEIAPLAENAIERAGIAAFNPAGELRRGHGLHHFLANLAAFVREPDFARTLALARAPETQAWLQAELGGGFGPELWLAQLDALQARHLPATLADARRHARAAVVEPGLALLAQLRETLVQTGFAEGVEAVLGRVFASRRLDLADAADRRFAEMAEAWMLVVRECAGLVGKFPKVSRDEWWEVALRQFGDQAGEREKPAGALELQGWLELPFEDAPHVVVAGLHDGCVPEAVVGDVFLPESLRVTLGLKANATRFARDSYLLHALVASRRARGRVDVLLGKVSARGEPLRPSRLLLQCAERELPDRIAHLFRSLESSSALPAWERSWRLAPRRAPAPTRLAPTAFRTYLECPFRFYLKHVLKMEAYDAAKRELDAFDFGSLCHGPLEKFACEPWRDCADERALAAMLIEELDRVACERFGEAPAVPVVAQLESARQRLRWAAKVQAQQRAEGWVVQAVERKFEIVLGGLRITGRIDRIDRHERTGAWRVIDYKTSDSAKLPAEAHLAVPREGAPEWARLRVDGRERQWIDLQLPLYVDALPGVLPEATERAACGYFNLPKAASATALTVWDGYSIELHQSALRCAESVVAAVRAEQFWPPNEAVRADTDAFAALFHRGVAASIAREDGP